MDRHVISAHRPHHQAPPSTTKHHQAPPSTTPPPHHHTPPRTTTHDKTSDTTEGIDARHLPAVLLFFVCFQFDVETHGDVLRENFNVEAPQMGLAKDVRLLAQRSWYWMRDAQQAFEFAVRDHFLPNELTQGSFSPCVFRHGTRKLWHSVYGDDHTGIGTQSDVDWYLQGVREKVRHKIWGECWVPEESGK